MAKMTVEASGIIEAPPEHVYGLLSEYHTGHPSILPKPYFAELTVEEGGQGAGTVFALVMKVMGSEQHSRMTVSEPEPGRVLVEEDADVGIRTSFTLEPAGEGRTELSIATRMTVADGLRGKIEAALARPMLHRIYKKQLKLIAAHFRD